MKRIWLILAAFLGLAAASVPASADVVYTLTCSSVACGSPSTYGTVTLKELGTGIGVDYKHVQVTVDLRGFATFAGTGAGYAINWNVTGNPNLTTAVTCPSPLSCPVTGTTHYDTTHFSVLNGTDPGNSYMASPFGSGWMYAIEYGVNGGRASNDNLLIFDVSKSGANLLAGDFTDKSGFMFAVDIWKSPSGPTFVVAAKKIPEPGTMPLSLTVIAGLAGLVMLRRRKLARA